MSDNMDFLSKANDSWEGFEEINSETMSIPFIKLAQDGTPQAKEAKPEYIKGLKPSQFFLIPGDKILGESFEFIILKYGRIYIEWLPDRGGFVGYHSVADATELASDKTFGKWKTLDGNDLIEYYTYFGVIAGREKEGPVILSLSSTGIKVAKDLNRVMTTQVMDNGERALPYYLKFKFTSVHIEKGPYDWYSPKFTFSGYINQQQYIDVQQERKTLPSQNVDYAMIEDRTPTNDYGDDDGKL